MNEKKGVADHALDDKFYAHCITAKNTLVDILIL